MNFEEIVGPSDNKAATFVELIRRLAECLLPNSTATVDASANGVMILQRQGTVTNAMIPRYSGSGLTPHDRTAIEALLGRAVQYLKAQTCTLVGIRSLNAEDAQWLANLGEHSRVPVTYLDDVALANYLDEYEAVRHEFFPGPSVGTIFLSRGLALDDAPVEQLSEALVEAIASDLEGPAPEELLLAIAAKIKRMTRLKVLVFGPGPNGGDIYRKRCELRDRLGSLGHTAHFGEDICKPDVLKASGLNVSAGEYLAAIGYDYIVILMTSPGSIGEAHDFARVQRLASKMMICVDQNHKEGYSAQGVLRQFEGLNGKMDWFEYPKDITDCHLSTRVLEQIQKLAELKQWEVANSGDQI